MEDLPPHRIRESARARRVLLRLSHSSGLEIVVPRGFSIRQKEVEELLVRHAQWIERTQKRFSVSLPDTKVSLPSSLNLRAIGRQLFVERHFLPGQKTVRLTSGPSGVLTLRGDTRNTELSRRLLVGFVRGLAAEALPAKLRRIAGRNRFSYRSVSVRVQKTRWGSYSSRGTISLNAKLLFLPPRIVEYVLLHELCHSRHLNHSREFYELLAGFEPRMNECERELRRWERRVPRWMQ